MGFFDFLLPKPEDLTLHVCMMGPRAVGKTTVLTSIFHETQQSICGTRLYLRAEDSNTSKLITYRAELQEAVERQDPGRLPASNTISRFVFGLGLKGQKPTVNIAVQDYPGEFLTSSDKAKRKEVDDFVSAASIILIAIDTPYLMEEEGKWNEQKNKIEVVSSYLMQHGALVQHKLVLFVPLKCERYFHDGCIVEVSERIKACYADLISFFDQNEIASLITPILTLGGMEFDHMEQRTLAFGDISQIACYRPYAKNPVYQPMFCPQPLYHLLSYTANYYDWMNRQPKGFMDRLRTSIYSYLMNDEEFAEEVRSISSYTIWDKDGFVPLTTNNIYKLN